MRTLPIKTISSPDQQGDIHVVQKVGIMFYDGEMKPFVEVDGERFILPSDLKRWAITSLVNRHIEFPCAVEFSILNRRACADFVVDN